MFVVNVNFLAGNEFKTAQCKLTKNIYFTKWIKHEIEKSVFNKVELKHKIFIITVEM